MIPPDYDKLLPLARVLNLHRVAVDGLAVEMVDGCVERSLGAAASADMYRSEEGHRAGLIFAAAMLFYLATNHCFGDGNKRAAWLSAVEILAQLGLTLDVSEDDAVEFVVRVADTQRADTVACTDDVVLWMAPRLVARS